MSPAIRHVRLKHKLNQTRRPAIGQDQFNQSINFYMADDQTLSPFGPHGGAFNSFQTVGISIMIVGSNFVKGLKTMP